MTRSPSAVRDMSAVADESGTDCEILRVAARLLRAQGLGKVTLQQVAAAAGGRRQEVLQFGSIDVLTEAVFGEVIRRLQAGDGGPWYGYGAGFRRLLAAARSFEDGYILLVGEARHAPQGQPFIAALRARTSRKLRHLLWFPDRPPPREAWPPLLDLALEPMISFANDALAHWMQNGAPERDELYVRWCGQMMRSWRENAAQLLDLDSPEADWPFDSENSAPLTY